MTSRLTTRLDTAVREHREPQFAAAQLLRDTAPELADDFQKLAEAFSYRLISEGWEERRDEAGGAFAPAQWPIATRELSVIDADTLALWEQVAATSTEPAAVARLADLLWEAKAGERPIDQARQAIDAYLLVSERADDEGIQDILALVRAIELAARISDGERLGRATCAAVSRLRTALSAEGPQVGTIRSLLRALVTLRRDRRPEELSGLLDDAVSAHAGDPYAAESMLDLKIEHLGGPQPALRVAQVGLWQDAAQRAREDGRELMRAHHLEEAHERAVRHGLAAEAQAIAVELQEIDPANLGMETVSATIEITDEQFDKMLEPILGQANWEDALRGFGASGPPGGTDADIDAALEEERQVAPLQAIFSKTVIGSQSAASIVKPTTDAARLALDRAQRRAFYADSTGAILYTRVLAGIPERFERPDRQTLTDFFTTQLIAVEIADRIARALELFWDAEYDEAVHVIVPRLEAVLRGLARRAGVRIITLPNGARAGGVRSLGELMNELRPALPPPWGAYLENLLVDQNGGLNLRNAVAHALRTRFGPGDAALLIQAACFLRSLQINEAPL